METRVKWRPSNNSSWIFRLLRSNSKCRKNSKASKVAKRHSLKKLVLKFSRKRLGIIKAWMELLAGILIVNKILRNSSLLVFLGKGVLKICCKFTEKHPCRSVISIKLQSSFIKMTLRHECSPVNLLRLFGIFRTPFYRNTYEGLLRNILEQFSDKGKNSEKLAIRVTEILWQK